MRPVPTDVPPEIRARDWRRLPAADQAERPRPLNLRFAASLVKREVLESRRSGNRSGPAHHVRGLRRSLDKPIFVLGAPRSGTTMLGALIGTADDVSYHFEPAMTKAGVRYIAEGLWSDRRGKAMTRLNSMLLLAARGDAGLRFAEKSPHANHMVPLLADAFPQAMFVNIVRDGRDAAYSLLQKHWLLRATGGKGLRDPGGFPHGPYPQFWIESDRYDEYRSTSDFHRCIWTWRTFTSAALDALAELPPERCIFLRYEDVVADPEHQISQLFSALGIRPGPATVDRAALVFDHSVGAWRRHLGPVELDVAEQEAGGLLRTLGYD